MLRELMDVFQEMLDKEGERLVLDEYVPKNGTYRLIMLKENDYSVVHTLDIQYERKTGKVIGENDERYRLICFLDYWSKLVTMNKPIDPKKIIHSNNYLSFAVKKDSVNESKLTEEIISGYYELLKAPEKKYQKSKAKALYQASEETLGKLDLELLNRVEKLVANDDVWKDIDFTKKDYCKLFFILEDESKTRELYEQEGKRYLIPNIYNNNDFNALDEKEIVGLPNNNMTMNSKKPYLANRTRKVSIPYLLNQDDVLLQGKMFDYLMGLASKGLVNIYVNPESEGRKIRGYKDSEKAGKVPFGYFLRIRKGKELEIHQWDTLQGYTQELPHPFVLRNIMNVVKNVEEEHRYYGKECDSIWEIQECINSIFFEGKLSYNFFTEANEISSTDEVLKRVLIYSRDRLFGWFRKGNEQGIEQLLDKISMELIMNSILKSEVFKARRQLDLRWSLEDYFHGNRGKELLMAKVRDELRKHMDSGEEWDFSGEEEFCYATGQLAAFLVSKSKANMICSSLINPLLNAQNHKTLKMELEKLYKKYNYAIPHMSRGRVYKILSRIMSYEGEVQIATEQIIAGFTAEILIYEKKESGE